MEKASTFTGAGDCGTTSAVPRVNDGAVRATRHGCELVLQSYYSIELVPLP